MKEVNKYVLIQKVDGIKSLVNDIHHLGFQNIKIDGDVTTILLLDISPFKHLKSKRENKFVKDHLTATNRAKLLKGIKFGFRRYGYIFLIKKYKL